MAIDHSVLSVSFGQGMPHRASEQSQHTAVTPAVFPSEGLYVEGVESERVVQTAAPNPELERFLSSLFSGE